MLKRGGFDLLVTQYSWSLELLLFDRALTYKFLSVFSFNYVSILHRF